MTKNKRERKMKKALITGITGQDGSYLAEFLLSKGYEVHGMIRKSSTFNTHRIDHIYVDPHELNTRFFLHYGDLLDSSVINDIVGRVQPDEFYNLGAQSHVKVSFQMPEFTGDVTGLGTLRVLEAIRRYKSDAKFYQASSSEIFGASPAPQNEETAFYPRSPYAAAKLYSYWITVNYREAYRIAASNGILFNHESPRRGETFVTRKITMAIANMLLKRQNKLYLGNLNAKRDWGFAPEYVEAMWLMLQQNKPGDFVIGTGRSVSVRDFVAMAFAYAGVELEWVGSGVSEIGIIKSLTSSWAGILRLGDVIIEVDPRYFRPTEVEHLQADISKAKDILCWEPRVTFDELVKIMVDYDLKFAGLQPIGHGMDICKNKNFLYTSHTVTWRHGMKDACL
jgi:GDPmannose 4,6-dehydratase